MTTTLSAPTRPQTGKPDATPTESRSWKRRLLVALPYLVTAAVVGAILARYPIDQIVAEMGRGSWVGMIPIALAGTVASLFIVARADAEVVRGCGGQVGNFDMVRAKGGSSLVDIVNYFAGHGAYAVWVARFAGLRAAPAAGSLIYIAASDLAALSVLASISMFFTGVAVPETIRILAPSLAFVLLLFVAIGPYDLFGRGRVPLFEPWIRVPRHRGYLQIGLRIFHFVLWVGATWWAARSFGLDIPFASMAIFLPVILLVHALPISVAGFGAAQGAWLLFLDHASGPRILAFQFLWNLFTVGAVVARGLPFVRRVAEEVHRRQAD